MHYTCLVLLPKPPEDRDHLDEMLTELLAPFDEELHYNNDTPGGKWDWWTLGGRWLGVLPVDDPTLGYLGTPGTGNNAPGDGLDATTRANITDDPTRRIHAVLAEGVWRDALPHYDPDVGFGDWKQAEQTFKTWLTAFWTHIPADQWLALVDYHS